MAEKVLMPKAGITVEECIITEWVVNVGDTVSIGDILFHYETDKATFECESTATGQVLAILKGEGDEVPVLEAVCVIGEPGESYNLDDSGDAKSLDSSGRDDSKDDTIPLEAISTDVTTFASSEVTASSTPRAVTTSASVATATPTSSTTQSPDSSGFIKISPRARIAAIKSGMNPTDATPTGPAGRIIEQDIRLMERTNFGSGPPGVNTASQVVDSQDNISSMASLTNEFEDIKFSSMRKATARAMLTSLSTMAQVTNQHSFDGTTLINLRKRIKESGDRFGLTNISYNDMIIYAVSRIISNHPDLNAHVIEKNTLRRFKNVNIGIAVDTPKGLYVPVVRNTNQLTLDEIAKETSRVAKLCQEGKATPELFADGTFTISNLGALGVEMFTPIINPPQTAILGVCSITTGVREISGKLESYPTMKLALTYDHCVIDGWPASLFLRELCQTLENFELLLLKEAKVVKEK
jgi:pyruvate dehydrogenase E2 component (dihydrolipoamide acetyltransferase)